MNYFNKKAETILKGLCASGSITNYTDGDKRIVVAFLKEVSRDTRHKAAENLAELNRNEINSTFAQNIVMNTNL